MAQDIAGKRIAFVVANEGIEQVELTEPWKVVEAAGGTPELIAPSQVRRRRSSTSTTSPPSAAR